jgi:hypothetical protein
VLAAVLPSPTFFRFEQRDPHAGPTEQIGRDCARDSAADNHEIDVEFFCKAGKSRLPGTR